MPEIDIKLYNGTHACGDIDSNITEVQTARGGKASLNDRFSDLEKEVYFVSDNIYNPALQTSETISPHYYVNGVPYSSSQYDSTWNCTALIPVEPSTTYTVAIIPSVSGSSKPWINATSGGWSYDENGTYISGSGFSGNTFTTPATAKYIRFNYKITDVPLSTLNRTCIIFKGSQIPESYTPYYNYDMQQKIAEIDSQIAGFTPKVNYVIDANGDGVSLIAKYDDASDIVVHLCEKGGNHLFDFDKLGIISNTSKIVSTSIENAVYFLPATGDWFAPFIVGAKNNADGDEQTETFTGGNHQYNNQGSGSTPTARTTVLKFFADNMEVTSGSDGCSKFEIMWTNLVQGYNTKKADGTGREILQENHRLIFDGEKFEAFVDIIPLEDINMKAWYGIQWTYSPFPNTRYIGGVNRGLYNAASADSSSGDKSCCDVYCYGTTHALRIGIDKIHDLGDRRYYSGTEGIFTKTYGKGYFYTVSNTDMDANCMYSLKGYYKFEPK